MSNDEDDKRDSAPDESDSSDESSSNEATSNDAERDDAGTESGESEPSESASSASTSAPLAKTEPASGTGSRMSAGARLAAAKAAKAVVKASKKEERKASTQTEVSTEPTEAEPVEAAPVDPVKELEESELGRAALRAGKWWESNQQIGWIAVAVAALAIVGFLGFQYHKDTTSAAVGVLLEDAVDIASARIVPEGEEPASDDGEEEDADAAPTFPTRAARNEAALEAYQAVIAQYPRPRVGGHRTARRCARAPRARSPRGSAGDVPGGVRSEWPLGRDRVAGARGRGLRAGGRGQPR